MAIISMIDLLKDMRFFTKKVRYQPFVRNLDKAHKWFPIILKREGGIEELYLVADEVSDFTIALEGWTGYFDQPKILEKYAGAYDCLDFSAKGVPFTRELLMAIQGNVIAHRIKFVRGVWLKNVQTSRKEIDFLKLPYVSDLIHGKIKECQLYDMKGSAQAWAHEFSTLPIVRLPNDIMASEEQASREDEIELIYK